MVTATSPVHQPTLLGGLEPAPAPDARWERIELDATAWIDVAREWWTGGDVLAERLAATVPWRQGRRRMWDRVVDDPRLSYWCRAESPAPDPALEAMRRSLARHYGRPLRAPGLNFYRDGRDSVAWHADRELRELDDTLVAIVTLGLRRPFLVRPAGGGTSIDLAPGSGDLLVMGGACQRDWEHAVPKTSRVGRRISVSWRWTSGRGPRRAGDATHATDRDR
ncbi:MAG: alpha-ketoglutarate-dependent dioxygenase AlkB [Acidimicrobiia bacterium]